MKAMRKTLALLLALVLMLAAIPATVSAAVGAAYPYGVSGDTVINTEEYIPDENFRYWLQEVVDASLLEDGLTADEAATVEHLGSGYAGIYDLTGIEFFTGLKELNVRDNPLGEIDLSNNTLLEELECGATMLLELDLSNNPQLKVLTCDMNSLTSLDLRNNPLLKKLQCARNLIESRDDILLPAGVTISDLEEYGDDFGGWYNGPIYTFEEAVREDQGWDDGREITTAMKESVTMLDISEKNIASLDGIEDYVNLVDLNCGANQLTSIDLSKNTALKSLHCYFNPFGRNANLDLSANTNLEFLNCDNMGLSELDVSENINLKHLKCAENNLTTLDVSTLSKLEMLEVNGNCMASKAAIIGLSEDVTLDFGEQREPDASAVIEFADSKFEEALFSNAGVDWEITRDGVITQAEAATVEHLWLEEKGIRSLEDIKYFTGLKELNCGDNYFTTLDISNNKNLVQLRVEPHYTGEDYTGGKKFATLESLIVGNTVFPYLEELWINRNSLTSLNLTNMPALKILECSENDLSALDLSGNPELEHINLGNMLAIRSVDFSKNPKLKTIYWHWGDPYELDVTHNPALETLEVVDSRIEKLDLSKNKNLERLVIVLSHLTRLDVTGLTNLKHLEINANYFISEDYITGLNKAQLDFYHYDDPDNPVERDVQVATELLEAAETDSLQRLLEIMGLAEDSWPTTYEEHYEVGEFDAGIRAILDRIEANYKRLTGFVEDPPVVEPDVPDFVLENISKIKIVGTIYNANANGKVGLKLNKPSEQAIAAALAAVNSSEYDTSKITQVEIELEGVETDSEGKLAHPVTLTMPIPEFLNALGLRILHYNDDGITYEVIIPTVNGDQTCSFTVDHFSLFAFVEAIDPVNPPAKPVTPPTTTTTSSDSGSSGGGGGSAATTSTAPAPVTKANAVSQTKTAIADAAKAGTSAVVKFKGVSTLSLANIKAMITAAGKTAFTIQADSLAKNGKAVDVRIALDPAKSTKDVSLTASTWNASAVNTKTFFKSFYSNALMAVSFGQQGTFGQPVKLAVKLDANIKKDALVFYSYDKATNIYKQILKPDYLVDANGYVHFTTELAGDIIISDGALAKK